MFDLGIQLLAETTDGEFGIGKIRGEFAHNLLYPIGGDAISAHLADGSKKGFLTSLVVIKEKDVKGKFLDPGLG
jgi:hypothetical protein